MLGDSHGPLRVDTTTECEIFNFKLQVQRAILRLKNKRNETENFRMRQFPTKIDRRSGDEAPGTKEGVIARHQEQGTHLQGQSVAFRNSSIPFDKFLECLE